MVQARQIKAARALLGWSQDELALAANLSVTTIRNLESGEMSPRHATANLIQRTIENAGLEFIEFDGVRFRSEEVKLFQGTDSCDQLLDDMEQTIREKGGEIVSAMRLPQILSQFCSINKGTVARLEELSALAPIKFITADMIDPPTHAPGIQFRLSSKQLVGAVSFFAYANKHAIVLSEGSRSFKFVVFNLIGLSQAYHDHFYSVWEHAQPMAARVPMREQRRAQA